MNLHINHLNGASATQRLTTEWEVAVLNALHRLGVEPQYEPTFPTGTSVPDVLIKYQSNEAVIDITTVSDRGLDDQNPVERLADELIRRVQQRGLNPDNFGLRAEGNWRDLHLGGPKPRLFIPRPEDFDSLIFDENFSQFLDRIASSGQKSLFRPLRNPQVLVSITYDPAQKFFSSNHLDYTVAFTQNKNPVYNRLDAKASQMRNAGFAGLMGIVLCDAGCGLLRKSGRQGLSLGASQVISNFLRNEPRIGFVLTLCVKSDHSGWLGPEHLKVVSEVFCSQKNPLIEFLGQNLAEQLPRPETIPINAYSTRDEGKSFLGGGEMSSHKIKMSARAVLGVLSGQVKQDDFIRDNQSLADHFGRMAAEGRVLADAKIEHVLERDDDWIEFHFSEPDPAVSRFTRSRTE
ncbi:MAG TPA: hypothetical protein VN822_11700 [Candidatus Acidoferrales bacterium]|nr:hypothetical protein [Candidatus Acidoferrales bacterium]